MKMNDAKLVMIIFLFSAISIIPSEGRVHVSVTNQLGNGKYLGIQCRSKDDDLRFHNLANGETLSWSFRSNVWVTTLFYCDLSWPGSQLYHFDAYSYWRDYVRCSSKCDWTIQSDQRLYGRDPSSGNWNFIPFRT